MKAARIRKLALLSALQLLSVSVCQVARGDNTINVVSGVCGCFSTSPSSPFTVVKNGSQNVTFSPGSGYKYNSVTIDNGGSVGTYSGGFSLSPKNGDSNGVYTASVVCTGATEAVTVTQTANGTIASTGNCGSNTWLQNSTASYVITPDSGYVLDSYTIDSVTYKPTKAYDNANPLTVTINIAKATHTITATYSNTRTVTVVQSGAVTGTVTSCPSGATAFSATGSASFAISPTVSSSGASLISSISVTPTSPQTGSTQTFTPTNGGTGYTCSNPFTFPMNELNQTMTVNYTGSDAVVKILNTNGSTGSTGGTVASCNNYNTDNWQSLATASYAIVPNSGYVLSSATVSPSSPTAYPAGFVHAAGYSCGNFTFPINAQTQTLTASFYSAVTVNNTMTVSGSASGVSMSCNGSTGICTATDSGGTTIATVTSCNGSNSWGSNQLATYTVVPANGYKLTSISAAGTSNTSPPAGGYTSCSAGYSFNAGSGTTIATDFLLSNSATIAGSVVYSSGVSGGDILVGGSSIVNKSYNAALNSPVTVSFTIPSGAGIKNLYWTPSGGSVVDVTSMLSCASLSPADFTSSSCQFTIPASTGTTPSGTSFNGVGSAGGAVKVVFDKAYTFSVSATTTGCGGSNGGLINGAVSKTFNVVNGSTVTATGAAASGYVIKDITFNGSSVGVASSQLGTGYSYAFGPITASGNTGSFVFTPVFTVGSNSPVAAPIGSGATGVIAPATQQVMCGASIMPITITATPPATLQNVTITDGNGNTVALGGISSVTGSVSNLGNVQKSWTITATFYQAAINTSNFSIVPPFVQATVLPNLLLMIDNSGSQYDLQYDSTGQCYDNNAYLNSRTYAGYFDTASFYSYNAVQKRFESGATLPASCTYRTAFMCVAMQGTKPNRTVSNFVASGNFLNYLSMSKLDIQKLILTGGKYDVPTGNLIAESRGCDGKRFVKVLSDTQSSGNTESLNNLTFVIRGPNASSSSNFNPAVQGGSTSIDIYDYSYANQIATCQTAFADWVTGQQQGTTQNDTNACISSSVTSSVYNNELQLIHACYYTLVKGNTTAPQGQINNVESGCKAEYTSSPPVAPSSITNNQAGDAVCSSVITHAPIDGSDTGYVGVCWNGTGFDDTCVANQINNFCAIMGQNQVTDPSSTSVTSTSYTTAMPGFFMDAGINSLGTAAATYQAWVKSAIPSGLVDQFKDYINFGAMVFNQDGAGSECVDVTSTTVLGANQIPCARHCSNDTATACYYDSDCGTGNTCITNTKLDGARVISPLIANGSVGDHASGLINQIDNISANSWTPWGEAFYEALGYLANDTSRRLQANDWDSSQAVPAESCRLNNILMITDGVPTADRNAAVGAQAQQYNDGSTNGYGTCTYYSGSKNVAAMAWTGYNRNIHNLSTAADHNVNNQYVTTYVAYSGPNAQTTDGCDPFNLMTRTAADGSGGNSPLYYATTYEDMFTNLQKIFQKVATSSASGTAASILNNSQGSGANLLQAVFFPKKAFSYTVGGVQQQDIATWIGELQNLWYYVDPYLSNSTVREDTDQNYILSMKSDYVVQFGYAQNQATVSLYQDVNGDQSLLTPKSTKTLDALNSLWKAGYKLWTRNLSGDPRQIYTVLGSTNASGVVTGTLQKFSSADGDLFNSNATAQNYMQITGSTSDELKSNANTLIDYITGIDQSIYRSRKVTIPNCGLSDTEGCKREWKLGDIVSSTPKVASSVALNTYDVSYSDGSYSTFLASNNYKNRGMTFVGGNDGMLHAFRLGILDTSNQYTATGAVDPDKKARMMWNGSLASYSTSDLGREEWAFIPMNALPYLKYLGDTSYTHVFYVDDAVTLSDVSIGVPTDNDNTLFPGCTSDYQYCQKKTVVDTSNNIDLGKTTWRTILIGGMGLGGATRDLNNTSCTEKVASGTCVKTPVSGIGYSSYFALDVTNPSVLPGTAGGVKFLWEFNANGQLGYSLSGPAIVRIGPNNKNGKWYAIFGSGPTGPIESSSHTFYGKSDQNLKLFVVDVATGALVRTIDTGMAYAFAGSLSSSMIDTDRNYSDDAVYVGYVQADSTSSPTAWNKGGILRLYTLQNTDPNQWVVKPLITGTGPVTTSITKLQDINAVNGGNIGKLWIYFGTGRYFYKSDMASVTEPFRLYGVADPCYSRTSGGIATGPSNTFPSASICDDQVSMSTLQNQTGDASTAPASTLSTGMTGWYINLATSETLSGNSYQPERVITNPTANKNGTVFFTTVMPSSDVCGVGGNTYIWALKYDTGATPLTATMQGSILLQVSTGDLQQVNLSNAFSQANQGYNMRRLNMAITGVAPTGNGMVGLNRPQPVKKLLHIQEK